MGATAAHAVEGLLAGARHQRSGVLATMAGTVTLFVGATGVVVELKDALNTIWEVKPKPGLGVRGFLRKYVVSLAAVVGLGFLLAVSLVVTAALSALGAGLGTAAGISHAWLEAANTLVSFGGLTVLFALIFRVVPDVLLRWTDVWGGALITTTLFLAGKFVVGFYLGRSGFESTYGAAASAIVLLTWVYYSAQIVFFGAEFTRASTARLGRKVDPEPFAEPAT